MKKMECKALALSLGVIWGIGLLILGLSSMTGLGIDLVEVLGSFYIGYKASFWGAIIGGIWGFTQGVFMGVAMGWLYNYFSIKFSK